VFFGTVKRFFFSAVHASRSRRDLATPCVPDARRRVASSPTTTARALRALPPLDHLGDAVDLHHALFSSRDCDLDRH